MFEFNNLYSQLGTRINLMHIHLLQLITRKENRSSEFH